MNPNLSVACISPRATARRGPWAYQLRDRIVQEALRAILDPIYETDFQPHSYGFRKGRCTMDAIAVIMSLFNTSNKYYYVIEGDIKSYFDTVHHRKLLSILKQRIADKDMLDLIWKFLKAGVMEDGLFARTDTGVPQGAILPECEFIDEGYSGATLVRPGLERLRDLCASGGVERLYVHSPDRLARKYAYQVLLIDEFQRMGIEVVFLNRELSQSPEDELLLQVQGMVAEYERAKILERSRRGKRHAAHVGNVTVMSGAPYGYRYVNKHEGGGSARYDILEEEARVVRQIFTWIGQERLSIGEVCRRLQRAEERTRTGSHAVGSQCGLGHLEKPGV